jgi:hypothetical protein
MQESIYGGNALNERPRQESSTRFAWYSPGPAVERPPFDCAIVISGQSQRDRWEEQWRPLGMNIELLPHPIRPSLGD